MRDERLPHGQEALSKKRGGQELLLSAPVVLQLVIVGNCQPHAAAV